MPQKVQIRCYPIARTAIDEDQVYQWLDTIGAQEYNLPDDNVTDEEINIGLAAKRCYMSFEPGLNPNVTKVRKEWHDYFDNILKSGHGSVLEHSSWTWAIEGCTRVFTAEMNRHRAGVGISEGSMRYIRLTDIPYWEPPSIQGEEWDEAGAYIQGLSPESDTSSLTLDQKRAVTRAIFFSAFCDAEFWYRTLLDLWKEELEQDFSMKKKLTSMMRRIIPIGVSTGVVYTINMRALRHIITMRSSPAAEEEIATVASIIAKEMSQSCPNLFGDFRQDENGYWRPEYVKV